MSSRDTPESLFAELTDGLSLVVEDDDVPTMPVRLCKGERWHVDALSGEAFRQDMLKTLRRATDDLQLKESDLVEPTNPVIENLTHILMRRMLSLDSFVWPGDRLIIAGQGLVITSNLPPESGSEPTDVIAIGEPVLITGTALGVGFGTYAVADDLEAVTEDWDPGEDYAGPVKDGPLLLMKAADICDIDSGDPVDEPYAQMTVPLCDPGLMFYRIRGLAH